MTPRKPFWGLLKCQPCWVPTARGWIVLLLLGGALTAITIRGVYPFLAITAPVASSALVVEGWAPDDALRDAMAEFQRNRCTRLYVTGGPIERGAPLSEYKTMAELGAATLLRFGMSTNAVQAVPAPLVRKDRTYVSALSLKDWLRQHSPTTTNLNVITVGPHARRTRMLFEAALGKGYTVGIIALPDRDYGGKDWWRTSQGFRSVTGEAIAYCYARLLFTPE